MEVRLTCTHKLGEGGQQPFDADAAHVDELTSQEGLSIPGRDRRGENHLRRRFFVPPDG